MFKSSFLWRLYAGFVAVISICAIVINLLLSQYIQESGRQALEEKLLTSVYFLQEVALPFLENTEDQQNKNLQILQSRITHLDKQVASRLTVINAAGKVISDSREIPVNMNNHIQRPEIVLATQFGKGEAERFSDTIQQNMKYLALAVKYNDELVGFVRVALPLKEIQQAQKQLTQYILTGCLLATLIALLIGFYFARRFSLPIIALTKNAELIAQDNFQQEITFEARDEIGKLSQAFNFMATSANDRVQKITEDRNKLATILSGLVEGVIAVDEQQDIIHINEAAARTLNISTTASIGSSVWGSINIVEIHDILKKVFAEGGVSQTQVRIPNEFKDTVIEVYGAALDHTGDNKNDTDSLRHGAILVLHDISELEMLENVRRDFVTNASHELKTPLTAIRGVIETILDDKNMNHETLWNFLQRVQVQTDRLVNIVGDLMSLSRLETKQSNELTPVVLDSLLIQSIKSFDAIATDKNISLITDIDSANKKSNRVLGDEHSLTQLFDNLIDNAIKYTPDNGEVKISLRYHQNNWLSIKVSDNGLGISQEHQARIFERFYRVDKGRSRELGGTGLGLAISKHVVEQHNGKIDIISDPDKGSSFTVSLPLI